MKRKYWPAVLLSGALALVATDGLSQCPTFNNDWGWVLPHPDNPRYLMIGGPCSRWEATDFDPQMSVTSYGNLAPCELTDIPGAARQLKTAGSTYARIWNWWTCDGNPNWSAKKWHGPWAQVGEQYVGGELMPVFNLELFDAEYWSRLENTVAAARNTSDGTGKRLVVEVMLLSAQEFRDNRLTHNPLGCKRASGTGECIAYNNVQDLVVEGAKHFEKIPYFCEVAPDPTRCTASDEKILDYQKRYVRKLIDVTHSYGNVIYEIMNEPAVEATDLPGRTAIADFGRYWADFIKQDLATRYNVTRPIAHDQTNRGLELPSVDIATAHQFQEDWNNDRFFTGVLGPLTRWVRETVLGVTCPGCLPKVVNVDEFANAERDYGRLRKKAWGIVTSGGHFHIEDPCPGNPECPGGANSQPWKVVTGLAAFKSQSDWQFHRAKPMVPPGPSDPAHWFFWMSTGYPGFDSIAPEAAPVQDHVGYLASHVNACIGTQLHTLLPASPRPNVPYRVRLWDPVNSLWIAEAEFLWPTDGWVNWCDLFEGEIKSRDDLVFYVRAEPGCAPIIQDVPETSAYYKFVAQILCRGISSGCSGAGLAYCPNDPVTRGQMAVFLVKANGEPPSRAPVHQYFSDVSSPLSGYANRLYELGLTSGCGGGRFCPDKVVTREVMALFLLRARMGVSYTPPTPGGTPVFADVPASNAFRPWIEDLYHRGITGGCASAPLRYCPSASVSRAQMAVFVSKLWDWVQ